MRIHNKSGKPMDIVVSENKLIEKCIQLENEMPDFLKDYFIFTFFLALHAPYNVFCLFLRIARTRT